MDTVVPDASHSLLVYVGSLFFAPVVATVMYLSPTNIGHSFHRSFISVLGVKWVLVSPSTVGRSAMGQMVLRVSLQMIRATSCGYFQEVQSPFGQVSLLVWTESQLDHNPIYHDRRALRSAFGHTGKRFPAS
ncbi:hypothetical protein BC827DRAFT_106662 [Russula dissimulans]|nr:hypothetical protein BC827DRAFT_106662 [Russula dissimulans]